MGTGPAWTEQEKQFLREHEQDMTCEEMSQALNRPLSSTHAMFTKLGLHRIPAKCPKVGDTKGLLLVKELICEVVPNYRNRRQWIIIAECQCDNKTVVKIPLRKWTSASGKSCGCRPKAVKHGCSGTRLYRIWQHMLRRCEDPNDDQYYLYGGRGIKVCDEWHEFAVFRDWALATGYQDDLSIDRFPNQNGHYEPSNCRWATDQEQARNNRRNLLITAFGETKTCVEWSEDKRCSISADCLSNRIEQGWDHERAVSEPWIPFHVRTRKTALLISAFGETKIATEWAKDERCKVPAQLLRYRVNAGWDHEVAIVSPPLSAAKKRAGQPKTANKS